MTKNQKLLLLASVSSIIIWALPGIRFITLPLSYLNTHLHEIAHAIMAFATGGIPQYILVNADGSGLTPVIGGNILLTASAGYPGTAIIGATLIMGAKKADTARLALKVLAVVLGIFLILLVRGDQIGFISAICWIPLLWYLATKLDPDQVVFAAQFLGIQLCLTAFQSLINLLGITANTNDHSDALILQQTTGIPDFFWATIWCLISAFAVIGGLRYAWNNASEKLRKPSSS